MYCNSTWVDYFCRYGLAFSVHVRLREGILAYS